MEKTIVSSTNVKYKSLKKLKTRKGRERQNRFLMEGPVVLEEVLSHELISELFIKESMDDEFKSLTALAHENKVPVTYLKDDLFDELSMTKNSQGIMGEFISPIQEFNLDFIQGKWLYLDGLQDPGNLGGIIRSANAFNAKGILLGPGTVDPLNDKVVRSTMASLLKLPIYRISDEQLEMITEKAPLYVMDIDGNESVESLRDEENLILALGNEGRGLRAAVKSLCKHIITIPINPEVDSLNVNVAGSIAMYFFEERS